MPDLQTLLNKFLVNLYAGTVTVTTSIDTPLIDSVTGTLTLGGTANITAVGNISGAAIRAGSASVLGWNARTSMLSPLDGQITATNQAATVGVGFDVLTDGTFKVRSRALADTAIVDASRFSAGGTGGVVTFGPAAVASITVKGGIITAIS